MNIVIVDLTRSSRIDQIVCELLTDYPTAKTQYCDAGTDAVDLIVDEIKEHPTETDDQIALRVAQRILQP